MIPRLATILLTGMLFGCSKANDTTKTGEEANPSTTEQVIDAATGRQSVRTYLDAKETIKDISAKQQEKHQKIQ